MVGWMLPKHQVPVRFRYPAPVINMKIFSIETSCDETAVSIIEAEGGLNQPSFKVLSNLVLSQIKIHEKYGGVFPNVAKREHAKNLIPLVQKSLEESNLLQESEKKISEQQISDIKNLLSHEPDLFENIIPFLDKVGKPDVDLIAVTYGPGLEPALWVGINAAKVLGKIWDIPVMPVNHMEGHISSVLSHVEKPINFPALALLISGGHTELVYVPEWCSYKIVGETKDDAVGEAFDKVARMLGFPYPGGPQISALAEKQRSKKVENPFNFPRPMLQSGDLNFSFSGLKTAVLYEIKKIPDLTPEIKEQIALAFEEAVVETLIAKTRKAIDEYQPKTLIVAGGVIANKTIRAAFEKLAVESSIEFLIPTRDLATDNALMIAFAAYMQFSQDPDMDFSNLDFRAEGNLKLS